MVTKQYLIAFLFVLLFFRITQAVGQLGLKAGIGMSDVVFSDERQVPYLGYETDYLTHRYPLLTFQAGISGIVKLNNHFDFQPELFFTSQGLNYDMEFIYGKIENKLHLYYLQLPLNFRYNFSLKKKHRPNFFAGPYFGLLIHSKRVKTYDDETVNLKAENANTLDFGLTGGFGYDFYPGKGAITTELRIGYSLIDVLKTQENHLPYYGKAENPKARNISLSLIVGYRFTKLFQKQK